MKNIVLLTLLAGAASFALACNGDNSNNDGGTDSGPADTGNDVAMNTDAGDSGGNPQPPALKTMQIDRMGRPAINTALNDVFDTTASTQGMKKNAYNADKNIANWGSTWVPAFAPNLAIYDALDTTTTPGDGCGNQVGFALTHNYNALAGLTANDQLYVDTSQTTCNMYLGVELKALNLTTMNDCGGRKLTYDVVGITYGAVAGVSGPVSDGTTAVAAKTNGTTFPYLAAPM